MNKRVKVLAEGPNGTDWLDGEIVGEWTRPAMSRTNNNPEPGGPVVYVPDCIYREKTFNATWEQVRTLTRTKQTNIRLSILARKQLDELCAATGMSQSEVIQTALDRFHQSEMIEAWQVADGADLPPDYEPTDDDSDLP